jgi:signal transduction histidine kinase
MNLLGRIQRPAGADGLEHPRVEVEYPLKSKRVKDIDPYPADAWRKGFYRMHSHLTAGILVRVAFSCLLVVCIFTPHARADQPAGIKKVLALFPSEGWSSPSQRAVYNGMKAVFDQSPRQDVILLGDILDVSFATGETEQRRLADFFRAKYAREDIDVVVPVTRPLLEFIFRYRDIMFPGIPIVFCMHSARELHRLDRASNVTGVAITVDIAGTIDLARNLQPGLRRLAVVAGTALVDRSLTSLAREIFKKDFQGQLEWIDLTGLHMQELLERVSQLPDSTAILFLNLQQDGSGRPYVPAEAMQLVSKSANAPLYNLIDTALGYGSLGGRLTTIEAYGREAAAIVLRVLSGEKAATIEPVVMRDSPPMFDWRELKRWKIDESALPRGSIIRFRETSLWEVYRWWAIGAFSFICLQTLLIAQLMNNLNKRKRLEEETSRFRQQLAHVSRVSTVGELGQNLAHEINQPLAAILTNAEAAKQLLAGEPPDLKEASEALDDIMADNKRAQEVIRRIRNLVKNTPPAYTRIDLSRLTAEAIRVIQTDAAAKGVAIDLDLESVLPPVLGDPVQLQQVALNLIVNAMEAVSQNQFPPRLVTVKTGRDGEGSVCLWVLDTGAGIDLQTAERLFEPFFTTKPQGLGLGLSISRSIVEVHGGSLSAASNLDKGASFCCRLPVVETGTPQHTVGDPNHVS